MTSTECPDRRTLEDLLLGKLAIPESRDVAEHLRDCDLCIAVASTLAVRDEWTDAISIHHVLEGDEEILNQVIERGKQLSDQLETLAPDATYPEHRAENDDDATKIGLNVAHIDDDFDFLATAQEPDEIGRLGDYRVLQVLGVGGMGIVFRAEDLKLKRQVALKAMKPGVSANRSAKDRFLREAQFTAAIEHDNIVQIYQVGEDRGVPFIAMPFLRGESLKTRLDRDGRLSQAEVARIGKEVAAGLDAAHQRGLIHRDIKPDNIWLEEKSGRAKILDFGLVRVVSQDAGLTQSGMVMGTPKYMAPEQAMGEQVDHRCDLFSLGSVLYHLLTGKNAFAGTNIPATLMAVAHQEPRPIESELPDVLPALAKLVTKLLIKDRSLRPQSATDVHQALSDIEHELQSSRPSSNAAGNFRGGISVPLAAEKPPMKPPVKRLIAAAAAGGLFLIFGVIIITVTNPFGKETDIQLPDGTPVNLKVLPGSTVSIREEQNSTNPGPLNKSNVMDGAAAGSHQEQGWHGWPTEAPSPAIAPFNAEQSRAHQEAWAKFLFVPVEFTNSIGMKFRLVPPGEFSMGSPAEEIAAAVEVVGDNKQWQDLIRSSAPEHRVVITQPVYIGVHEVTQQEYEAIMGQNPSHFAATGAGREAVAGRNTNRNPVERVSWNDASEFCAKLNAHEQIRLLGLRDGEAITNSDDIGYQLPTEAQWEFACRAGTTSPYWTGETEKDLPQVAWFALSSLGRTHTVGGLKANPFGLCDVHGNVWEWVRDCWDPAFYVQFQNQTALNPIGLSAARTERGVRGGRWNDWASGCRASLRNALVSTHREPDVGFRVACPVNVVRQQRKITLSTWTPVPIEMTPPAPRQSWPTDPPPPAIAPFTAEQAREHQDAWARFLDAPVEYTNSIGAKFRLIPPGTFMMGSTPGEIEAALQTVEHDEGWQDLVQSEGPKRNVILKQAFYIGIHEVTQAEFETVMGESPSCFTASGVGKDQVIGIDTARSPVEQVSWNEAVEFCLHLSDREQLSATMIRQDNAEAFSSDGGYRLPTETEWELVCRAGTTTRFWNGDPDEGVLQAGWFSANAGGRTHAVGERQASPFGLFDVHGNVWEWVQDEYQPGSDGQRSERFLPPSADDGSTGPLRICRGGSWFHIMSLGRSATRLVHDGKRRDFSIGFRIVLPVNAVKQNISADRP